MSTRPTTSMGLRQFGHHSTLRHGVGPKSDRCSSAALPQIGHSTPASPDRTATVYSRAMNSTADGATRSGVQTGSSTNTTSTAVLAPSANPASTGAPASTGISASADTPAPADTPAWIIARVSTFIPSPISAQAACAAVLTSRAIRSSAGQPSMVGTSSIRTMLPSSLAETRSRIPSSAIVISGYSGSHTDDTASTTAASVAAVARPPPCAPTVLPVTSRRPSLMRAPRLLRRARSAPMLRRAKRCGHRSGAAHCRGRGPLSPPSAPPSRSRR